MENVANVLAEQIIRNNRAVRKVMEAQEQEQDAYMFEIFQATIGHIRAAHKEDYEIIRRLGLQREVVNILRANDETAF